jgi:ABC-type antimicrobial peptide transport system permease subunit
MALGAPARSVLWLVLGKGALLVGIGAILGAIGAYIVSKVLMSLIPSLPTRDPLTLVLVALALIAVALVACYIPARRATRVDPLLSLKSD